MKEHVRQSIAIALALVTGNAFALETRPLLNGRAVASLLDKNCIRTDMSGVLPVRFDSAVALLNQPDLVRRIQTEYCRSVSKEGISEFPIVGTGNGDYHYVNEKNQRTDILELCRKRTSDTTFDLVYHATGKRYFGKYEVLIHIRAIDAGTAGTVYTAAIHAYPRNAALRFFARRTGTTERYFRRKTQLVARVATRISSGLRDTPAYLLQPDALSGTSIFHE